MSCCDLKITYILGFTVKTLKSLYYSIGYESGLRNPKSQEATSSRGLFNDLSRDTSICERLYDDRVPFSSLMFCHDNRVEA